jgi:hypothetical protein
MRVCTYMCVYVFVCVYVCVCVCVCVNMLTAVSVSVTDEGELSPIVSEYEEKAFKGPSSIVVDATQTVYFTDSGHLGETSLQSPSGSVRHP